MSELKDDDLDYMRKGIKLAFLSLCDLLETIEQIKCQQKPKIRRRRFAGECRVIRLDDRRVEGARV